MSAAGVRIVEDDTDIATVGVAAGEAHSGAERIGQRNAERQQQRPRAVVSARCIAILELKSEQHLRQVVPARAELIEHLLGRNELLLLDPVHLPACQNEPRDLPPIDFGGYAAGVPISHRGTRRRLR